MMGTLAYRRDTGDDQMVIRFAVDVGSPELLAMLYVMTAADYTAVGPDVWDGWKEEILSGLYYRAMEHLAGDTTALSFDEQLQQRRDAVREQLGASRDGDWFFRHLQALPPAYLVSTPARLIADDLRLLNGLGQGDVIASGTYQPESDTVQFTIGTREDIVPGIFHRLTGALSSHGLGILSAEINTLADGLVIDRFTVNDPDYAGRSPPERIEQVNRTLVEALRRRPTIAHLPPHLEGRDPCGSCLAHAANVRPNRQQQLAPLYGDGHFRSGPRGPAVHHHPQAVRVGAFGRAGQDRHAPRPGGRRLLRRRSERRQNRGRPAALGNP